MLIIPLVEPVPGEVVLVDVFVGVVVDAVVAIVVDVVVAVVVDVVVVVVVVVVAEGCNQHLTQCKY